MALLIMHNELTKDLWTVWNVKGRGAPWGGGRGRGRESVQRGERADEGGERNAGGRGGASGCACMHESRSAARRNWAHCKLCTRRAARRRRRRSFGSSRCASCGGSIFTNVHPNSFIYNSFPFFFFPCLSFPCLSFASLSFELGCMLVKIV